MRYCAPRERRPLAEMPCCRVAESPEGGSMTQRAGRSSPNRVSAPEELLETTRREFLQVLIGGSTLMIGGVFLTREQAAALPGPGNTSDQVDIGDSLVAVEQPYKYNLTLEVTAHNRVR